MARAQTQRRLTDPGIAPRDVGCPPPLYDARFRRLIPAGEWAVLPQAVRRRFTKRLTDGRVATYRGAILSTRMNRAGRWLSQLCRLIGAPLPLHAADGLPALVMVSEDHVGGGQLWTRVYARTHRFPQVIHSAKRFAGGTGLEEHIGAGFGMALGARACGDALMFISDHYFWQVGGWRVRIPAWLAPATTQVTHRDLGDGAFAFDLMLTHPRWGQLVHQKGIFHDEM